MKNCIYSDDTVLHVEDGDSCPLEFDGAELVDETTIASEVTVTALDPWTGFAMLAIGGILLWYVASE